MAKPPAHRLTTTQRGYGWTWQKARKVILAQEPLCRFCKEEGRITVAEEVDHIDGDSFNNDRENLRPMCRPCHLKRTARDQAFGKHQWRPEWLKPATISPETVDHLSDQEVAAVLAHNEKGAVLCGWRP